MKRVRYHPDARAEFLHSVEYYAAISTQLAERYEAVHTAEAHAAGAPETWPKYSHKTRRVIDRRFKFSLVFLHTADEIYVLAIAPMKKKPGYWRRRLGDV
jgi:hypothetical protein